MNKTEIQSRIEGVESMLESVQKNQDSLKSVLTSLKADLSKCDCEDKAQAWGIEQEKCWHAVDGVCGVWDVAGKTKREAGDYSVNYRPAYMPECRQVTDVDAINASSAYLKTGNSEDMARELHKLGFRIKVTP